MELADIWDETKPAIFFYVKSDGLIEKIQRIFEGLKSQKHLYTQKVAMKFYDDRRFSMRILNESQRVSNPAQLFTSINDFARILFGPDANKIPLLAYGICTSDTDALYCLGNTYLYGEHRPPNPIELAKIIAESKELWN